MSIRDNVFVIYAVVNDALEFKKIDIDIQLYVLIACGLRKL